MRRQRDGQRTVSSGHLVCDHVKKSGQGALDALRYLANVFRQVPASLSGMETAKRVQVPDSACRKSGVCCAELHGDVCVQHQPVEGKRMNYITPELLISVISGLVVCVATMFWFFFRRLYRLIDGLRGCIDRMKDRLEERIRTNDERHDDLQNKFDVLQKELYELKCFVHSRHGEQNE